MNDTPTNWKSIAVFLGETPQGQEIAGQAAALARRFAAHLIGIHGIASGAEVSPAESFARGARAIDDVVARHLAEERSRVLAVARRFAALAEPHDVPTEFRVIRWGGADEEALIHSLHCDLVILGHPTPHGLPESWTTERLGMASGLPFLLIPEGWKGTRIGDKALVAWNGSREARRAITDAMPLLSSARSVTVLVVDPVRAPEKYGEDPGTDIATFLARHCGRVELQQVDSAGAPIADVICSRALDLAADLIVIGAYSHARSIEMILGGTTRTFLARMPLPALISR